MQPEYDIVGIGNAIIDVIAPVEPPFLSRHGMVPGSMTLVDADRARVLAALMPAGQESSGGSVANSCAVAAMLGARVAFLGKVADDPLGVAFRREITAAGVHYPTPPLVDRAPTACCLIFVTPDAQRTMNTYLGACVSFAAADVPAGLIEAAAVTYLEGYLFDPPSAQQAFRLAADRARAAGRRVALSLSDAFCVERHRDAFLALLRHVDILFANAQEITSLYACDLPAAMDRARRDVGLAVVTLGADGSHILQGDQTIMIAAAPTAVVDTTGAGDCYAAGFLRGYTAGQDLAACGMLASRAAAACIATYGARPPAASLPPQVSSRAAAKNHNRESIS